MMAVTKLQKFETYCLAAEQNSKLKFIQLFILKKRLQIAENKKRLDQKDQNT